MDDAAPLLSVRQLVAAFPQAAASEAGRPALNEVSFDVRRGGVLGVVGESGSGKSLTALSILRLLPATARVVRGQISFQGQDLLTLSEQEMQRVRGHQISMVFQEPATALSPVHTVGWHLATALRAVGRLGPARWLGRAERAARSRSIELLARVELPDPERLLDTYPHHLSAGMRRRVLIALALAGQPALLIADEPTTGLDGPIQAQILDLFARLTREAGLTILFITHDLCALSELATEIVVLHEGRVVEAGSAARVLCLPRHPYTRALLEEVPGFAYAPAQAREQAS